MNSKNELRHNLYNQGYSKGEVLHLEEMFGKGLAELELRGKHVPEGDVAGLRQVAAMSYINAMGWNTDMNDLNTPRRRLGFVHLYFLRQFCFFPV